jgi:hypothetical protein
MNGAYAWVACEEEEEADMGQYVEVLCYVLWYREGSRLEDFEDPVHR